MRDSPSHPQHVVIQKQRATIKIVRKQLNQVLGDDSEHTYRYYAVQLKTIQQHWQLVQTLHKQIWEAMDSEDTTSYDLESFTHLEVEIKEQLSELEERSQPINNSSSTQLVSSCGPRLPKIDLPHFDGDYLKWRQFRDLFVELVDRQPIPESQKMWYLKTSITGEAKSLIQHFTASAASYSAAWKIINDRYENSRLLVKAVLNRLLMHQNANIEDATAVRSLHDTTLECLLNLHSLGIATDGWDPMLLHLLIQRLSKTNHTLWEQSLQEPRKLPSLEEFLRFLNTRFQSLEAIESRPFRGPTEKKKAGPYQSLNVAIEQKGRCIMCREDHPLYKCEVFDRCTPNQRLALVEKANRCVNCLKPGHMAKNCTSGSCSKCQRKHNTLLHLEKSDFSRNDRKIDAKLSSASSPTSMPNSPPVSLAATQHNEPSSKRCFTYHSSNVNNRSTW